MPPPASKVGPPAPAPFPACPSTPARLTVERTDSPGGPQCEIEFEVRLLFVWLVGWLSCVRFPIVASPTAHRVLTNERMLRLVRLADASEKMARIKTVADDVGANNSHTLLFEKLQTTKQVKKRRKREEEGAETVCESLRVCVFWIRLRRRWRMVCPSSRSMSFA